MESVPQSALIDPIGTAIIAASDEDNGARTYISISDCSCKEAVRQQMADC